MSADLDNSRLRHTLSTETVASPRDTGRMTTCPRCHSEAVRRSRARTWWETLRKTITSLRPYRCDRCDWRGWRAVDPVQDAGLRTDAPPPGPPDLRDTAVGRHERPHQLDLLLLDEPQGDEQHENLKPEI